MTAGTRTVNSPFGGGGTIRASFISVPETREPSETEIHAETATSRFTECQIVITSTTSADVPRLSCAQVQFELLIHINDSVLVSDNHGAPATVPASVPRIAGRPASADVQRWFNDLLFGCQEGWSGPPPTIGTIPAWVCRNVLST